MAQEVYFCIPAWNQRLEHNAPVFVALRVGGHIAAENRDMGIRDHHCRSSFRAILPSLDNGPTLDLYLHVR